MFVLGGRVSEQAFAQVDLVASFVWERSVFIVIIGRLSGLGEMMSASGVSVRGFQSFLELRNDLGAIVSPFCDDIRQWTRFPAQVRFQRGIPQGIYCSRVLRKFCRYQKFIPIMLTASKIRGPVIADDSIHDFLPDISLWMAAGRHLEFYSTINHKLVPKVSHKLGVAVRQYRVRQCRQPEIILEKAWHKATSPGMSVVLEGTKRTLFVNRSAIAVIQSFPFFVLGRCATKSMAIEPHCLSGISRGCGIPSFFVMSSLLCWQVRPP